MASRRPKGQGGVRNRGSDRTPNWVPYFYIPDSSRKSGRRQVSGPGHRRKADAEAWLRSRLEDRDRGRVVTPSKRTLGDVLDEWLVDAEYRLAENTAYQHRRRIEGRIRPALGERVVSELRPSDLTRFLHGLRRPEARAKGGNGEGLSERTIELHFRTLNLALDWAVGQQLIAANPLADVQAPKAKPEEMVVWTSDQLGFALQLLEDERLYPLFHLAAFTGARRSELLGLHWSNVDLDGQSIRINRRRIMVGGQVTERAGAKSRRGVRQVELDSGTVAVLRQHRAAQKRDRLRFAGLWVDDPNVFVNHAGRALGPGVVASDWRSARARLVDAGLPDMRFHGLRHTHASILLAQGEPVIDVAQRIGDAPETVWRTYAHFIPGRGRATAEAFAGVVASRSPTQ